MHRHLLVAPLFALVLVGSLGLGLQEALLQAETRNDSAPGGTPVSANENITVLGPGAAARVSAKEGTTLVRALGHVELSVGDLTLDGLSGVFHTASVGGRTTVTALTTPVLVRGKGFSLLIPAGMQWRAEPNASLRDARPVPRDFFARAISDAATIPIADPLPQAEVNAPRADLLGWLRFSASVARVAAAQETNLLGHARYLVQHGTIEGLQESLAGAAFDERLLLLGETVNDPANPAVMELLSVLPQDSGTWSLLRLHPQFRIAAWTFPLGSSRTAPPELLALPLSDTDRETLPAIVLDRWTQAVRARLSERDGIAFLQDLIRVLDPYLHWAQSAGYPQRTQIYAKAARDLAAPYRALLSSDLRLTIDRWEDLAKEAPADAPKEQQGSSSSAAIDTQALEAQTYASLRSAGALFTVQTAIHAVDASDVAVDAIVFGGPFGDRLFSFHYDPQIGHVSGIIEHGETLPFGLPLEKFVEWVHGGR
jgi:hypothetical protein